MARRSPKTRLVADSTALVDAIVTRGMTAGQAAETIGISKARLSDLLAADRPVRFTTAAALRKALGANVIRITD